MEEEIATAVGNIFLDESDHKSQSARLKALLQSILSSGKNENDISHNVSRIAEAVVNKETVSMVVSRQFVSDIVAALDDLKPSLVKEVAKALLNIVQSRLISYEEQVTQLRFRLADLYEGEGDSGEAAKILTAIPLETGQRTYSPELKMRTYLRIAQLALDCKNSEEAESFVNRASMLFSDVSKDDQLIVVFKSLYARVLDHRKKFIEAAQRYYDLSLFQNMLTTSEKAQALTNAISCTVLASPGAQRSRMLTTLFKDERSSSLAAYGILEKMYFERLIRNDELMEFENSLSSHQRVCHGGWSLLQRAVIEHNFTAVSKIFTNITFEQLAKLLNISCRQAEKMAWQIIADGRVAGTIDQVDGIVHFTYAADEDAVPSKEALAEWDQHIAELCQDVNNVTDVIIQKHRQWVEARKPAV
uniref:COP9 signalosome complex subunit 4 n=1 Tax=Elaeophora elaphi TaxID=1147741 RepID=A0A0R3RVS5_9BILA